MYGKKVKLRLLFLSFIFLIVSLSVFLILKSLEENVVYFISPTEIKNLSEIDNKKRIRVGGMVKEETVKLSQNEISFVITDFKNEINVVYSGVVPNLFAEEKGVEAVSASARTPSPTSTASPRWWSTAATTSRSRVPPSSTW